MKNKKNLLFAFSFMWLLGWTLLAVNFYDNREDLITKDQDKKEITAKKIALDR